MGDLRKQRNGTGWQNFLTPDEAMEIARIDIKLSVLRRRARRLSMDRVYIQNRATQRARAAR